jgi:hypothetical protein
MTTGNEEIVIVMPWILKLAHCNVADMALLLFWLTLCITATD